MLNKAVIYANDHMQKEKAKMKSWYDRSVCEPNFQPGEKLLALLPGVGSLLQAW